jgi:hypothetical protein
LPREIFRQVFPWVSGFSNFALPVVILLGLALIWKYKKNARHYPFVFVLAFCAQLFAEHITVGNIIFILGMLVYSWFVEKKRDFALLWAAAGFVAGGVLMFSHAAYTAQGAGGAHAMPTGFPQMLQNAQINFVNELTPAIFSAHLLLALPLCILCIYLIKGNESFLSRGLRYYFMLYAAWGIVRLLSGNVLWNLQIFRRVEALMVVGFVLALGLCFFKFIECGEAKRRLLTGWFALLCLNAPLMLVNPIGPRCFFISYIILALMALRLYAYLRERQYLAPFPKQARAALLGAVCAMTALLFIVYGVTFLNYRERAHELRTALEQNAPVVYVRMLTFPSFVWTGEPADEYFQLIYRRFHGIPNEVELILRR